jgi:hypothetical protein
MTTTVTIIAKNETAGDLALSDLPVPDNKIPASGQVTLTDYANVSEIQADPELRVHIDAGNAIINDGVRDLTQTQSQYLLDPNVQPEGHNGTQTQKQPCVAGTQGNIANLASGAPLNVDGVTMTAGARVLVKMQTDGTENGLYQVDTPGTGENGSWSRAPDNDENDEMISGVIVRVTGGEDSPSVWSITTPDPITIGSTSITWRREPQLPTTSVDNTLPRFSGTDGRVLQSSGVKINDSDQLDELETVTFKSEHNNGNSGSAYTLNWNNGQMQRVTLTGNATVTITDPPGPGHFSLCQVQDATGNRQPVWPSWVKWRGGSPPTFSGANKTDIISFRYAGELYYAEAGLDYS